MSDNTDHDMATTDGKNTHHIHGSVAIANVSFVISQLVDRVPRDKKEAWGKVHFNDRIQIIQYIFQMFNHYQKLCFTNQIGKTKNFVEFSLTSSSD